MRRVHRSWRWLWWPLSQTRRLQQAEAVSGRQVGGDTLLALAADPIYGSAVQAVARARQRHG